MSSRRLSLVIPPEYDGLRVSAALRRGLGLSAGLVTRLRAREGAVKLDGENARTIDKLRAGQLLTVEVGDVRRGAFAPSGPALAPLWEDEDILIINKPAGMATHGRSERGEPTVGSAVARYLGGDAPFHPVNRLDRGVSGVMCAAKNGYMHDRLRRILHTDAFCREYLAIAAGETLPDSGRLDGPIARVGEERRFGVSPDGAPSVTLFETLARGGGLTLLRVRPLTGRTHQIRVHFASAGAPLLGDALYGEASAELSRPALHSASVRLIHPLTGEELLVSAPLPEDMRRVLERHEIETDIL